MANKAKTPEVIDLAVLKIKGRFEVVDKATKLPIANACTCTVQQRVGESEPTATVIIQMPISE